MNSHLVFVPGGWKSYNHLALGGRSPKAFTCLLDIAWCLRLLKRGMPTSSSYFYICLDSCAHPALK